jgi:HK97 family phage prohead protease
MTPNRVYSDDQKLVRRYALRSAKSTPLAPELGEVKAGSGKTYSFVLSTSAIDRMNDQIFQDGWQLDNYKKNPVVLWSHDASMLPVGRASNVRVSNGKLLADMQFAPTATAQQVERLVEDKVLNSVSVGFRPTEYKFNQERGGVDYKKQELLEFSIVNVPANAEASRVRALTKQELIAERKAELEEIRAGGARMAAIARRLGIDQKIANTTKEQRDRQRKRELEAIKLRAL